MENSREILRQRIKNYKAKASLLGTDYIDIVQIEEGAYIRSNRQDLKKLVVPDFVNCIMDNGFKDCNTLDSVVLSKYTNRIMKNAFLNCNNLSHITLSNSTKIIERYAFCNCKRLKEVKNTNGIKVIQLGAFRDTINLIDISIPDDIATLGEDAFMGSGIKKLNLNATQLRTIPLNCFKLSKLEEVNISGIVSNIEQFAFSNCANLHKVCIDATGSRLMLDDYVFNSCSNLEEIIINTKSLYMGNMTFRNCKSVKRIILNCNYICRSLLYTIGNMRIGNKHEITLTVNSKHKETINEDRFSMIPTKVNVKYI